MKSNLNFISGAWRPYKIRKRSGRNQANGCNTNLATETHFNGQNSNLAVETQKEPVTKMIVVKIPKKEQLKLKMKVKINT